MKISTTLLFWLFIVSAHSNLIGQHINEFHYDNVGSDQDEFIEVVIPDPQPGTLTEYRIVLYNGSDSMVYDSRSLQLGSTMKRNCSSGLCYYVWMKQPWIQNDKEGIAFVRITTTDTTVIDFISYEGTLTALDGPAKGVISMDIGIFEDNSTPIGYSLQKTPGGSTWFAAPHTKGILPIVLISFDASYLDEQQGVLIEWQTATEINNQYFQVEKSVDQRSFRPIAKLTGAENSQGIRYYRYFDWEDDLGRFYYRLKQVDFNNSVQYSPVVEIVIKSGYSLADIKPMLHNQAIYIPRSDYRYPIDLTIFDALGRKLFFGNQVQSGDFIPVDVALDGVLFYLLSSQGLHHSGRLMVLNP